MRNIPVFTTEFGVASLVLKEIPYTSVAYIHLQSTLDPAGLLEECIGFCRAAGAVSVYATGHEWLGKYPLHCRIIPMRIPRDQLADTEAEAIPLTRESLEQWRQIYQQKMTGVDHAAYMDQWDARKLLEEGRGWFVRRHGKDVGILAASEDRLEAVAAIEKGGGRDGVLLLKKLLCSGYVNLEVASTNSRALALYRALGFETAGEEKCWYKIL